MPCNGKSLKAFQSYFYLLLEILFDPFKVFLAIVLYKKQENFVVIGADLFAGFLKLFAQKRPLKQLKRV
jgi:hypothetical protein